MGAHRFQLAGAIAQILQRADSRDPGVTPDGPHGHIGRHQTREIERKYAAWRRMSVHGLEMQADQIARRRAGQIVGTDVHSLVDMCAAAVGGRPTGLSGH